MASTCRSDYTYYGEHLPLEDVIAGYVRRQLVGGGEGPARVEGGAAEDRRVAAREVQLVEVRGRVKGRVKARVRVRLRVG
eukprot:scaffold9929_cov33-Phaeocystis_antarctica.AAC.1